MNNVGCTRDLVLIVGIALFPLCSIQHFIWPLSWCLLADICNHTWIPECGYDELMDAYRLFIDECDLFEYNCDHETDYEVTNYSECFKQKTCPVAKQPCPSRPTCPDHRYHRMGDRYVFITPARRNARKNARRNGMRMDNRNHDLPERMLKGKRRYTPRRTKRTFSRKLVQKVRYRFINRTTIFHETPTRTVKMKPTRTASSVKDLLRDIIILPETTKALDTTYSYNEEVTVKTITSFSTTTFPITFQTVVLKKEIVMRFGRKMLRVVKKRAPKQNGLRRVVNISAFKGTNSKLK